ncbi:hypothetical protein KIPE111705_46480 [Kibdelosporangium persicum]
MGAVAAAFCVLMSRNNSAPPTVAPPSTANPAARAANFIQPPRIFGRCTNETGFSTTVSPAFARSVAERRFS